MLGKLLGTLPNFELDNYYRLKDLFESKGIIVARKGLSGYGEGLVVNTKAWRAFMEIGVPMFSDDAIEVTSHPSKLQFTFISFNTSSHLLRSSFEFISSLEKLIPSTDKYLSLKLIKSGKLRLNFESKIESHDPFSHLEFNAYKNFCNTMVGLRHPFGKFLDKLLIDRPHFENAEDLFELRVLYYHSIPKRLSSPEGKKNIIPQSIKEAKSLYKKQIHASNIFYNMIKKGRNIEQAMTYCRTTFFKKGSGPR